MLDGLQSISDSTINTDSTTLLSNIASLSAIVRNKYDIADDSTNATANRRLSSTVQSASLATVSLGAAVMSSAVTLSDVTADDVEPIFTPLQSAVSKSVVANSAATENVISAFTESVNSFGQLLIRDQVIGESAVEMIETYFRIAHTDLGGLVSNGSHSILSVPMSEVEKALSSSVGASLMIANSIVNEDSESTDVSSSFVQFTQLDKSLWARSNQSLPVDSKSSNLSTSVVNRATPALSHVVRISAGRRLVNQTVTVTIPLHQVQSTEVHSTNISFECFSGNYSKLVGHCPDSHIEIEHNCDGRAGIAVRQCPVLEVGCRSADAVTQLVDEISLCRTVSKNADSIVCDCLVTPYSSASGGRRLTSSSDILADSGALTMVAMASYTVTGFADTFTSTAPEFLSADAAKHTTMIITLFGAMWIGGAALLIIAGVRTVREREQAKKRISMARKANRASFVKNRDPRRAAVMRAKVDMLMVCDIKKLFTPLVVDL